MDLDSVTHQLAEILQDASLCVADNLDRRMKALSDLAFTAEVLASARRAADAGAAAEIGVWLSRIHAVRLALEAANRRLFDEVRDQVLALSTAPPDAAARAALRARFDRFTRYRPGTPGTLHAGFEGLDALISGVFLDPPLPQHVVELEEESIPYQPTPTSVILELIDRLPFDDADLFCDIGSGSGIVAILVNLLTGVKAYGVEIDPALCSYAQRCARRFGLSEVSFVQADARRVNLHDATVFYLFTPFVGAMLRAVLWRLAQEAAAQPIRVCSYGPGTPIISREPWLVPLDANGTDEFRLACFESR